MKLKIKKLTPEAIVPKYATPGAAAFDLYALADPYEGANGVKVTQDESRVFRTGLSFEIPPGWVMLINSRSGHGFKSDIRLSNCQGVIDSDYRGEVMVKLAADGAPFVVMPNERIAQAMLVECPQVEFEVVGELSDTERGTGGLGSTGK